MANLQFLSNVIHNGVIFSGQQIRDNKVVSDGMIVDVNADTRGLKNVADNLIERGLAQYTERPATHSSNFVNGAQEALPVDAPSGSGQAPNADQVQPAGQVPDGFPQRPASAPLQTPAAPKQPTPEEVAAAAAAVQ